MLRYDWLSSFNLAIAMNARGGPGIVLATVIGGIMAYVLPAFLVAMGLLVAVVQAIVFTSLVTIYYMLAIRSAPEKDY